MGNTASAAQSTTNPQKQEATNKPIQSSTEAIKQVAVISAGLGQHMDHVCARIQPLNAKSVELKGPQLPT